VITLTLPFFRSNRLPSASAFLRHASTSKVKRSISCVQLVDARFAVGGWRCRRLVGGVAASFDCGRVVHAGADASRASARSGHDFRRPTARGCGLPCRVRAPAHGCILSLSNH
jgi:hypothetical protein